MNVLLFPIGKVFSSLMRIPLGIVWHRKIGGKLAEVTFCIFKIFIFLNLERAPAWTVPRLFLVAIV